MVSRLQEMGFWQAFRLLVLAAALALAAVVVPSTTGPLSPTTTLAEDEDDQDDDEVDQIEHGSLDGQILAIYNPATNQWSTSPSVSGQQLAVVPGMLTVYLGTVDGLVPVALVDPFAVQTYGLELGDHVQLGGRDESGVFVADSVSVVEECCPRPEGGSSDDDSDDGGDDGDNDEDNDDEDNDDEDNGDDDNDDEDNGDDDNGDDDND
jgi:hypothetical protein